MFRFQVEKESKENLARKGVFEFRSGIVETPAFMPVGTQASVKTVSSEELHTIGFGLILSNTYHLALRPGAAIIEELGGLQKFMGWNGAILTDSGGYQVMSLSSMRKISENGVSFQSHIDGSAMFLSPEKSIEIQGQLGVNISMALDVCPPYPATKKDVEDAMNLTHAWAPRNLSAKRENQTLFGIVQGGVFEELRRESANTICSMDFDGIAIGGVCVGEPTEMQYPVVEFTAPLLPKEKPRYLMGVGHPKDIIHAVKCGVDLFDCVLPTRMARHNTVYTLCGRANLLNKKWESHNGPIDEKSVFPGLENYSAAYLRHLFKSKEPLGARLATLHNLYFYHRLMQDIRHAIDSHSWKELENKYANC